MLSVQTMLVPGPEHFFFLPFILLGYLFIWLVPIHTSRLRSATNFSGSHALNPMPPSLSCCKYLWQSTSVLFWNCLNPLLLLSGLRTQERFVLLTCVWPLPSIVTKVFIWLFFKWNWFEELHIGMLLVTRYLRLKEIWSNSWAARKEIRELKKGQSWGDGHLKLSDMYASVTTQSMTILWLWAIIDVNNDEPRSTRKD